MLAEDSFRHFGLADGLDTRYNEAMKTIVTSPTVDHALHTLGPEEVRRLHAWFDHLANWDEDAFVRENSHALADVSGAYVLRTSSDFRIFFTITGDTINIVDVAKRQAILRTAAAENR
jgi:mRNA-degrading endonuclease RelE of RelBE toxin-antitoxin system